MTSTTPPTPAAPGARSRNHADRRIPLGRAPRPTTGPDLAGRVQRLLVDEAPDGSSATDRVTVTAELGGDVGTAGPGSGADVASLAVDCTGLRLPASGTHRSGSRRSRETAAPAGQGEPALLHVLTVVAHPLHAAGVPVDLDLEARGMRFRWVEDVEGGLSADPIDPDDASPVSGTVRVAASQDRLVEQVRALATENAGRMGLSVSSLDVRLDQRGPRSVRIDAVARVRKGFLSAVVELGGTANVDDAMVLTFDAVELSSRNPVVAALLGTVRGKVEAATAKPVDLAAALPPGLRLTDVRVDVGDQIVVEARLA